MVDKLGAHDVGITSYVHLYPLVTTEITRLRMTTTERRDHDDTTAMTTTAATGPGASWTA
jgi:hypothetical protein